MLFLSPDSTVGNRIPQISSKSDPLVCLKVWELDAGSVFRGWSWGGAEQDPRRCWGGARRCWADARSCAAGVACRPVTRTREILFVIGTSGHLAFFFFFDWQLPWQQARASPFCQEGFFSPAQSFQNVPPFPPEITLSSGCIFDVFGCRDASSGSDEEDREADVLNIAEIIRRRRTNSVVRVSGPPGRFTAQVWTARHFVKIDTKFLTKIIRGHGFCFALEILGARPRWSCLSKRPTLDSQRRRPNRNLA